MGPGDDLFHEPEAQPESVTAGDPPEATLRGRRPLRAATEVDTSLQTLERLEPWKPSTTRRSATRLRSRTGQCGWCSRRVGRTQQDHTVISRIARQLGIGAESLCSWVKQAQVDEGQRPGVSTEEKRRIAELEKEVKELRASQRNRRIPPVSATGPVR